MTCGFVISGLFRKLQLVRKLYTSWKKISASIKQQKKEKHKTVVFGSVVKISKSCKNEVQVKEKAVIIVAYSESEKDCSLPCLSAKFFLIFFNSLTLRLWRQNFFSNE